MVWALDKAKQYGWFALKLLTLIIAVWLIIHTLAPIPRKSWAELISHLTQTELPVLLLLCLLSLANWALEIVKWQTAVRPHAIINFPRAARETLLAYSIGFITPLKLGEYAIKPQFYPEIEQKKIMASNFYCHLGQLICTLIFGSIGLLNFGGATALFHFDFAELLRGFQQQNLIQIFGLVLIAGLGLVGLLLYGRHQKHIHTKFQGPWRSLLKILILSVIRFVIFSSMMVLCLHITGSTLIWSQAIFGIWTMYLIQLVAPTFSMLDIAVKSGGALLVFKGLISAPIIMGAILLQYFLSQVLPLIVGLTLKPNAVPTP